MAFTFIFSIFFIFLFMGLLTYNFAYFHKAKHNQIFHPRNFYKYEGRHFVGHLVHYTYLGTDGCIKACRNNKECFAVTIINVNCCLQSKTTALSSQSASDGMTIYTRLIPDVASRSYCKKYKHVCGECKCIDQMETKMPYQCDCTVAGTRDNCDEHQLAGFKTSGVYLINLRDSTSHQIFCKMDLDGKGYMLIMRRLAGHPYGYKHHDVYLETLGDFQANYWFGLRNLHNITNTFDMKLKIEYVKSNYVKYVIYMNNFRIREYNYGVNNFKVFTTSENYLGTNFWICRRSEYYWQNREVCSHGNCETISEKHSHIVDYGWWWSCRNAVFIPTHKDNIWFYDDNLKNFKMYLTTH